MSVNHHPALPPASFSTPPDAPLGLNMQPSVPLPTQKRPTRRAKRTQPEAHALVTAASPHGERRRLQITCRQFAISPRLAAHPPQPRLMR